MEREPQKRQKETLTRSRKRRTLTDCIQLYSQRERYPIEIKLQSELIYQKLIVSMLGVSVPNALTPPIFLFHGRHFRLLLYHIPPIFLYVYFFFCLTCIRSILGIERRERENEREISLLLSRVQTRSYIGFRTRTKKGHWHVCDFVRMQLFDFGILRFFLFFRFRYYKCPLDWKAIDLLHENAEKKEMERVNCHSPGDGPFIKFHTPPHGLDLYIYCTYITRFDLNQWIL